MIYFFILENYRDLHICVPFSQVQNFNLYVFTSLLYNLQTWIRAGSSVTCRTAVLAQFNVMAAEQFCEIIDCIPGGDLVGYLLSIIGKPAACYEASWLVNIKLVSSLIVLWMSQVASVMDLLLCKM